MRPNFRAELQAAVADWRSLIVVEPTSSSPRRSATRPNDDQSRQRPDNGRRILAASRLKSLFLSSVAARTSANSQLAFDLFIDTGSTRTGGLTLVLRANSSRRYSFF